MIAETSISALFVAAVIPGIILGLLMLLTLPFAKRREAAVAGTPSLDRLAPQPHADLAYGARLWQSFRDAFWGLLTPVVILGGIYSGAFTPTEAAIIAMIPA